jgi:hypothetical protein
MVAAAPEAVPRRHRLGWLSLLFGGRHHPPLANH